MPSIDKDVEQLTLSFTAHGSKNATLTLKNWLFLMLLNRLLPYDPAIPLLGIYPEKWILCLHKDLDINAHNNSFVHDSASQPKFLLTGEWIKQGVIHPHNRILLSNKKERTIGTKTWMSI